MNLPPQPDETALASSEATEAPRSSGRAFTSLLLGVLGCLLLAGSIGLFWLYKNPPGSGSARPGATNAAGAGGAIEAAISDATKKPLQRAQQKLWLNLSAGAGTLSGVLGLIGIILGVLSLRLDGPPRATAGVGTFFSTIAFLGLFLAGYNKFVEWQMMGQEVQEIGRQAENVFGDKGIYGKAFKMADDLLGGHRGGIDTLLHEDFRGQRAPDLRLLPVNGDRDILLGQQKGVRPVMLAFLATDTASSADLIQHLKELHAEIPPAELLILAVSPREDAQALRSAVEAQGIRFYTGKAESLVEPYKDALAPTIFGIDAQGIVRGSLVGDNARNRQNVRNMATGLRARN